MKLPTLNDCRSRIERYRTSYEPTVMCYLDVYGNWQKNPTKIRDRISCEIWYTLWRASQDHRYAVLLEQMIMPFFRDTHTWITTTQVFREITYDIPYFCPVLMFVEVLYVLLEYAAYKLGSNQYVSEWDSRGRDLCLYHGLKAQELLSSLYRIFSNDSQMQNLLETLNLLRKRRDGSDEHDLFTEGLFNHTAFVIAEEEAVRRQVHNRIDTIPNNGSEMDISAIDMDVSIHLHEFTRNRSALVRPCLDILTRTDIPITSGLQFEASSILGAVKDPRCTEVLLEIFKTYDHRHTNIRSNIIYALGRIPQTATMHLFVDVLKGPDTITVHTGGGVHGYKQSTIWEKGEALWGLGKLGASAVPAISLCKELVDSKDPNIQTALTWALGQIGTAQKSKYGGIDITIVSLLLNMLLKRETKVFDEAVYALKDLALPDFLHTLYLQNIRRVPASSLKPCTTGLYELSETLFYLISRKTPVIMAVTGDSGTGKTYFCEAIKDGFCDIQAGDILYLMRDSPGDMYYFKRMLGIKFLQKHFDPEYYQDYPVNEKKDDPERYFQEWLERNSNKKLILLDGWMDQYFFHKIMELFYLNDCLDIIVNFRTTLSTRRHNLETREGFLENVRTCMSYIEDPVIEDTIFFRSGNVRILNLDNSLQSRVSKDTIKEIFSRRKVDTWGNYIDIGEFETSKTPVAVNHKQLTSNLECKLYKDEDWSSQNEYALKITEARFRRTLNENTAEPHLLETVELDDFAIKRMHFFTQGQLACCDHSGKIGIFTGLDDRAFFAKVQDKPLIDIAVIGPDIITVAQDGSLMIISFNRSTISYIENKYALIEGIVSDHSRHFVTRHADGSVRLWDMETRKNVLLHKEIQPVSALAINNKGMVVFGNGNRVMSIVRDMRTTIDCDQGNGALISTLGFYIRGNIVLGSHCACQNNDKHNVLISIIDMDKAKCQQIDIPGYSDVKTIRSCYDGRILAGLQQEMGENATSTLALIDPRSGMHNYHILGKYLLGIRDCMVMGPRIITCGSDNPDHHVIKIWGTEFYVRTERDKSKMMPAGLSRPSYYNHLF